MIRLILPALLAALAAGCTMRTVGKTTHIGLDPAAVMGTELARFKLSDGSEGSLRRLGDDYSIRLDSYYKVAPLGNLGPIRQIETRTIQGRVVLTFHYLNRHGCVNTRIVTIEQPDVLNWSLPSPDCTQTPNITIHEGRLLEFAYDKKRYALVDGWTLRKLSDRPTAERRDTKREKVNANRQRVAARNSARKDAMTRPGSSQSSTKSVPDPLDDHLDFSSAPAEKPVVIRLE